MFYRTTLHDNMTGTATQGVAYVWQAFTSHWREIGRTNHFKTYPRSVRARNAANRLCFKDAERRGVHSSGVEIVIE